MMHDADLNPLTFDDFDALATETIMLSESSLQWATQICQAIPDETEQWHTFLRALAVAGFDQWLNQGAHQFVSEYRTYPPGSGVNLRVGHYRICILPMGSLSDDHVAIPLAAANGSDPAHLYVLVDVQEEVDQVRIIAGLRCNQIQAYQQQGQLEPTQLGSLSVFWVPIQTFDNTPEQLLLYLSCLEPETMTSVQSAAQVASSPSIKLRSAARTLPINFINTGRWLQNQLDEIADQLAWTLLPPLVPPLTPAAAMRSTPETLAPLQDVLASSHVTMPDQARGAYQDFHLAGLSLRLYAFVWPLKETAIPEWSLLLCLGAVAEESLPTGIYIQVEDQTSTVVQPPLAAETHSAYLYTQAIGHFDEQFKVQIGLPNGPVQTFPMFGFEP
ncbi:MAG: DUF1822 family protein [Cyanobacteria bacterium P01_F01_bin.3]